MKKWILVAVVAMAAGVFFLGGSDDEAERDHNASWRNQIWIDKIPVRETDKLNAFAAIDDPTLGIFQSASQWEGDYTIFTWKESGGSIEIEMMQTGKKHKLSVTVRNRDCGRFDLCMTVKGAPRGPDTYYSMEDWVIEGGRGLSGADLAALARRTVLP